MPSAFDHFITILIECDRHLAKAKSELAQHVRSTAWGKGQDILFQELPELPAILRSLHDQQFSKITSSVRERMLAELQKKDGIFSPDISIHFQKPNPNGDPFPIDPHAPEQVASYQNVINLLYRAEKGLECVERYDFGGPNDTPEALVAMVYNEIEPHLTKIIPILPKINTSIFNYFTSEDKFIDTTHSTTQSIQGWLQNSLNSYGGIQAIARWIGQYSGATIHHLDPNSPQNLATLTPHLGAIPKHISAIKAKFAKYTGNKKAHAPTLSAKEIKALEDTADALHRTIVQQFENNPFKISKLILNIFGATQDLYKQFTQLRLEMLKQTNEANAALREAVIHQLSDLRDTTLVNLFHSIDRFEFHFALRPGVFSQPTLAYLEEWYSLLVIVASGIVDIPHEQPHLLKINDLDFMRSRANQMLNEIAINSTKELRFDNQTTATNAFFGILRRELSACQGDDTRELKTLPAPRKQALLEQYPFLYPNIQATDYILNLRFLRDLDVIEAKQVHNQTPLTLGECFKNQPTIQAKQRGTQATLTFRNELAKNMIDRIYHQASAEIVPWSARKKNQTSYADYDPYQLDEDKTAPDIERFQSYQKKVHEFTRIMTVCEDLSNKVRELDNLRKEVAAYLQRLKTDLNGIKTDEFPKLYDQKQQLLQSIRTSYLEVQPYLMLVPLDNDISKIQSRDALDHHFINLINNNPKKAVRKKWAVINKLAHMSQFSQNQGYKLIYVQAQVMLQITLTQLEKNLEEVTDWCHTFKKEAQKKLIVQVSEEFKEDELKTIRNQLPRQDYLIKIQLSSKLDLLWEGCSQLMIQFSPTIQEKVLAVLSAKQATLHKQQQLYQTPSNSPFLGLNMGRSFLKQPTTWKTLFTILTEEKRTPFPEIENDITTLQTADQVIWIKQLINCVYYTNQFVLESEQLEEHTKYMNIIPLALAYWNVFNAGQNAIQLIQNQDIRDMVKDILRYIDQLTDQWNDLKPLYFAAPDNVTTVKGKVEYSAIWYPLQLITVFTEHINTMRKNQVFSISDATRLQTRDKEITLTLESYLGEWNKWIYLKLTKEVITGLPLLNELVGFWKDFKTVLHKEGQTVQKAFRENYLKVLIEIDQWEIRTGLTAGTLSKPVQTLLETFYLALLEGSQLPANQHLRLAINLDYFQERIRTTERALNDAKQKQKKPSFKVDDLQTFVTTLNKIPKLTDDEKKAFQPLLKRLIPELKDCQARFTMGLIPELSPNIDQYCLNLAPSEMAGLKHIQFLAKRNLAQWKGELETAELKETLINEQLSEQLATQKERQIKNAQYVLNYWSKRLEEKINELVGKHPNNPVREEFRGLLKTHLIANVDSILLPLKNQPIESITETTFTDASLNARIEQQVTQFKKRKDYDPYRQLETICDVLFQMKDYCELCKNQPQRVVGLFGYRIENQHTLAKKMMHVDALIDIAKKNNPGDTPQARIEAIKEYIKSNNFTEDMYKTSDEKDGFWEKLGYLLQQVVWFFSRREHTAFLGKPNHRHAADRVIETINKAGSTPAVDDGGPQGSPSPSPSL